MRRQDILDSIHLAWEVTQLESPDRDILCMDMYDPILSKLFTLQLEDPQLDEMTNRIEDVVEWAQSLFDIKRYAESLSLLTQMLYTINYNFEREQWYGMIDDFNCMDYSDAFDQMMTLFEKLLHENFLPVTLTEPVMRIIQNIKDEEVLINYTSWDISPLLDGPQPHRPLNERDSPIERLRSLRNR